MRKKKNLLPRLDAVSAKILASPAQIPAHDGKRIAVELGCGMGDFAVSYAARNPGTLLIAFEKVPEALVVAAEKGADIPNLFFVSADAANLAEWFAESSVDELHIQFPDPWHKKKQSKRRLTHKNFLSLYAKLLKPNANLRFKTDNANLAEFTAEELTENSWQITQVSRDWHNDPARPADDIVTGYERKFAHLPITVLTARFVQSAQC